MIIARHALSLWLCIGDLGVQFTSLLVLLALFALGGTRSVKEGWVIGFIGMDEHLRNL